MALTRGQGLNSFSSLTETKNESLKHILIIFEHKKEIWMYNTPLRLTLGPTSISHKRDFFGHA